MSDNSVQSTSEGVSDRVVLALRKTRPWVVFIAVCMVVGAIFMVLAGIGALIMISAGLGATYLVASVVQLLSGIFLFRYSRAINNLLQGGGAAELDSAVEAQASYWRLTGYLMLSGFVLMLVFVAVLMVKGPSVFVSEEVFEENCPIQNTDAPKAPISAQ